MISRITLVVAATTVSLSTTEAMQGAAGGNTQQSAQRPAGLELPLELIAFGEDPGELNRTGEAMEVVGDYLFVGAPGDRRVDVWYREAGGYTIVQQLFPPGEISGDSEFGQSLAGDGELLVVGSRTSNNSGHVSVYRRGSSGLYVFDKVLQPSNGAVQNSLFADRLAVIEDELIVVSAWGELSVHVFEAFQNGNFPTNSTRILNQVNTGTTPSMSWLTGFGSTVGLHRTNAGDISILIGMRDACFYQNTQEQAPDEDTQDQSGATAARTGGVAVVQKNGTWQLDHRFIPEWSKTKDFGFSMTVDGPRVAVGAVYSNVFSNNLDAGTASVYEWNGQEFELVTTIWPSFPYQNAQFGFSLALCGDHLVVGQPFLWGGPEGRVEVFRLTNGELIPVQTLSAPDGNSAFDPNSLGDSFGRRVVCNAYGEVIIAAPFSAPSSGPPPLYAGGALYLYK